jgi:hypothetical protein
MVRYNITSAILMSASEGLFLQLPTCNFRNPKAHLLIYLCFPGSQASGFLFST